MCPLCTMSLWCCVLFACTCLNSDHRVSQSLTVVQLHHLVSRRWKKAATKRSWTLKEVKNIFCSCLCRFMDEDRGCCWGLSLQLQAESKGSCEHAGHTKTKALTPEGQSKTTNQPLKQTEWPKENPHINGKNMQNSTLKENQLGFKPASSKCEATVLTTTPLWKPELKKNPF